MIDYTLLEESATDQDIIELCEKANMLSVKSVCVLPKHVALAAKQLENSKVLVCTVISFPEGTNTIKQKISETNQVISNGADEVDMVLNYHELQGTDHLYEVDYLVEEVSTLVDICHSSKNKNGESIILKVIVESGVLTESETKIATDICLEAEADFIKTSTGKVSIGAELNKIKVMYDTIKNVNSDMRIKASGGVRTAEQINSMLGMVDRFGMGYAAVDKLNNLTVDNTSSY
jgi:deoxyribose-phosphate aldolase